VPLAISDAALLARLVSFDSTSAHSNLPLSDWIADYLDRPGVRIERNRSADGTKANLVVTIGPKTGPEREGLVLSGHMDVVPAGDGWESDPFALASLDGRYVARGACDMKGFLALAMNVAVALRPERLRRPLVLLFTYDEEVGTVGARHFVDTWTDAELLPRATLIGEPTSLRAVRTHKGHLKLKASFRGRSAHSGYPHLGVNAIEPAGTAITALAELGRELARERPASGGHFPEVPYVALSVTRIEGGTADNVIPDRCALEVSARLLPGMRGEDVLAGARNALEAGLGGVPFELDVTGESPALELREDAQIYRAVCHEVGQAETVGVSFATDAGWLQRLGLECVIFGPGSIEVAHKPNEWLPADEFARARGMLERVVDHFCGEPSA
jgi:acetylornithine deacetylase